jgi:hypothetical protein
VEISVEVSSHPPVRFQIDETGRGRAFFILGIRKSGSTLLNRICTALAKANDICYVDVAGTFFAKNIDVGTWVRNSDVTRILRPGNAYGGFRNMPGCLKDTQTFLNAAKVLLIRDPRDALVSEYFSNAHSHKIPGAAGGVPGARDKLLAQRKVALQSTVEEYVRSRADLMARTFAEYKDVWADGRALKLKYEDNIFDKEKLIRSILGHFRWYASDHLISSVVTQVDIRPNIEDPTAFVRKVVPGDHKEKLSPATITYLNDRLGEVLDCFEYER